MQKMYLYCQNWTLPKKKKACVSGLTWATAAAGGWAVPVCGAVMIYSCPLAFQQDAQIFWWSSAEPWSSEEALQPSKRAELDHRNAESKEKQFLLNMRNTLQLKVNSMPNEMPQCKHTCPSTLGNEVRIDTYKDKIQNLLPITDKFAFEKTTNVDEIPCIGSWGQCGAAGGHWRCCLGGWCEAYCRCQIPKEYFVGKAKKDESHK